MKRENYITIQGWMVSELKLSGNELVCYALIYGFTQDEESEFKGSLSYIAEWLNISKGNARLILKKLVDKGHLIKRDELINNVRFCRYKASLNGMIKTATGMTVLATGGVAVLATNNNILDNIEDNKENNKKKNPFDVRADLSYVDEAFLSLWKEWLDYKDEIGKPYKAERGAKSQYASWIKLSDNNPILAEAIIKRSIEQSWEGLFALNDKQKEFFLSDKSPYKKQQVTIQEEKSYYQ